MARAASASLLISQRHLINLLNGFAVCTVRQFFERFPTDDACLEHVMEVRFGLRHVCAACGQEDEAFQKLANRKAYCCAHCGHHVYLRLKLPRKALSPFLAARSMAGVPWLVRYCSWPIGASSSIGTHVRQRWLVPAAVTRN